MVKLAKEWYASGVDELNLTIDHVSLSVEDLGRAKTFYSKALAPLALQIVGEVTAEQSGSVGFVCFRAGTRAAVRDFHAAALEAGAKDNGGPGVRPEYHNAYYAAFVLSPEGHNIEAVCFEDES